jgi:hypothetical protein
MSHERTGMEKLRIAVNALNYCRESFLDQFTSEELLKIHAAWTASGWDIFPDQWTARQVQEALQGTPPKWTDEECTPVYSDGTVGDKEDEEDYTDEE